MNDNEKAELANYFAEVRKYFDDNAMQTKSAILSLQAQFFDDHNLLHLMLRHLTEDENKTDFYLFLGRFTKNEDHPESLRKSAQDILNGESCLLHRSEIKPTTPQLRIIEGGLQSLQQSYPPSPDSEDETILPTPPHSDT